MIGKIQHIPLREVWKHEERDFSAWLAANIDVLNEILGLQLNPPECERATGCFSADLVAEDADGQTVIIEDQLERSDHDHLGKLLTYVAAFNAKAAIWIVGEARAEHAAAVAWLNQTSSASFYLLKAEAIRIGESPPALSLTRLIGPTAESKAVGTEKRELASRHTDRRAFWTALLPRAKGKLKLHGNISPGKDTWLSASSGIPGFYFSYQIGQMYWRVTLEISNSDPAWNKAAFRTLLARRSVIEREFGGELSLRERPETTVSWITLESKAGGYRSPEEEWEGVHHGMIDAMGRLYHALKPELSGASDAANAALKTFPVPTFAEPIPTSL